MTKPRTLYTLMTLGGAIGTVAAFLQTLEKIELLKNKDALLPCNLNSVFSCTNVLNSWQSSVFGFPNSIMCMALFVVFTVSGIAGLAGSKLTKGFRLGIQGLSLFTLAFALWFLQQSTYSIQAICIFCLFCFTGLLLVNWAWLRINADDLPLKASWKKAIKHGIQKDYDTLGWVALAATVALAMVLQFR